MGRSGDLMDKVIEFCTHSDDLTECFAEAVDITPRGGGLEKIAGVLQPEIASFIKSLRPDPQYQYVLMTPMGAFEVWGMNVNGDIFPEISLSFDLTKDDPVPVAQALEDKWLRPFGKKIPPGNYRAFGYKTFLDANRYRHHVNKNPELSYGGVVLSVWNPMMHRVELIVRHDREKAKRVGAEEIVSDLDEGKQRQISMGCKVPFDVCTKCGHISRTPNDYCTDLRFQMGSVLDSGIVIGAVNFFPRFFDLSDVFIPAAKESGVLQKVAAQRYWIMGPEVVTVGVTERPDPECLFLEKTASAKTAATDKSAEISKKVLPNSGYRSVATTSACEPDLPKSILGGTDFSKLLTTLAMLGIVLKPREFQYGMLKRMGKEDLAEKMHGDKQVFSEVAPGGTSQFSSDDYSPQLARLLAPLLADRSGFSPHLPRRVVRITVIKAIPEEKHASVENTELLEKVASAYSSYRRAFRGLADTLAVVVESDPEYYRSNYFGEFLTDHMEKVAADSNSVDLSAKLTPLYLFNAHRDRMTPLPSTWHNQLPDTSPAKALLQPVQ
jgi:hypothetical protein